MLAPNDSLSAITCSVKPYAYVDLVSGWFTHKHGTTELGWLKSQCGKGGLYFENRPARFDHRLCQRVELRQPRPAALAWFAERGAFVNRTDFALDRSFPTAVARDDAFGLLHQKLCRGWHQAAQGVRVQGRGDRRGLAYGQTRYDAPRRAPNLIAAYAEPFGRNTGELDVIHIEWRARGVAACRAAGVHSAADLISFDHRGFWLRRLRMIEVDYDRLARLVRNRSAGTRARNSAALDRRLAYVLRHSYDTAQELVDDLRAEVRVERALRRLPIDDWLPPAVKPHFCNYPQD